MSQKTDATIGEETRDIITQQKASGVRPLQFVRVDKYTTFTAEYGMKDGNVIIHFFLPRREGEPLEVTPLYATPAEIDESAVRAMATAAILNSNTSIFDYWLKRFPECLEQVVREVLQMEPPQVLASYTKEVSSWWLQIKELQSLDPNGLVFKVFAELDKLLDVYHPPAPLETIRRT